MQPTTYNDIRTQGGSMRPYRWPCPTHMPSRCMTRTATDIPPLREATGGMTTEGRLRPPKHNDTFPSGRPHAAIQSKYIYISAFPTNKKMAPLREPLRKSYPKTIFFRRSSSAVRFGNHLRTPYGRPFAGQKGWQRPYGSRTYAANHVQ